MGGRARTDSVSTGPLSRLGTRARLMMRRLLVVALVAWVGTRAAAGGAGGAAWALLKGGGQFVMIRHARTDGSTGDPPGFKFDDCTTQRNLVDQGREDAQRIGRTFAARGVAVAEVLS